MPKGTTWARILAAGALAVLLLALGWAVANGLDEDGDVVVLEASKTKKLIGEMNMGSSVYGTPVPANGALFLMNRNQLWAIAQK
jgi:hypothetical protein